MGLNFLTRSRLPWGHRATNNISVFVDLTIGGEADVNKDQRGGGGRASRHNITSCIKCLDDNTVLLDNAIMLKPDYFIFTRNKRHQRVNMGAESHKYVWDDRELSKYKGKKCKVKTRKKRPGRGQLDSAAIEWTNVQWQSTQWEEITRNHMLSVVRGRGLGTWTVDHFKQHCLVTTARCVTKNLDLSPVQSSLSNVCAKLF